ncbi:Protein MKS1 [Bienertia sinuspersici]
MDPYRQPENPSGPNRRENQIQGPRPSPLRVSRESHKISKKPPIPPKPTTVQQQSVPATGNQPVIIYSVSPKPIFVEPSNFRSIVQHLTGKQSELSFSGDLPVSPAARYASIERTSPSGREKRDKIEDEVFFEMMNNNNNNNNGDVGVNNDNSNVVDVSQNPGILSPSPANLPAISSAMFSPMTTMENQLGLGFGGMNELMMSFMPSPSSLFLGNAPVVSPSPSSVGEYFNLFDF